MAVHTELGPGFLEPVYQEALAFEMQQRGIPFAREVDVPIQYKGRRLGTAYRADFICYGTVLVELKALRAIGGVEEAQIINYLKATGLEVGLLLSFGSQSLLHHRYANSAGKLVEPSRQPLSPP